MLLVAVLLTRSQAQILEDDAWTYGGLLAVEMDSQVATLDGVVELFAHRLAEVYVDLADIPLLEGIWGQTVGHLEAELGSVLYSEGVSQIGGVSRVIIEVAVVAEEGADACALPVERVETEGGIALDESFLAGGVDECLHRSGKVDVGHGVEPIE